MFVGMHHTVAMYGSLCELSPERCEFVLLQVHKWQWRLFMVIIVIKALIVTLLYSLRLFTAQAAELMSHIAMAF